MSQRTIAVDIDDVLADNVPAFIAYGNEKWGTNLKPEDYHEHWSELWQVDLEEVTRRSIQLHDSGIVSDYEHFSEAKEALQVLSKKYKLVIVTSRRLQIEKETLEWIDKYFEGLFQEVHFAGMWDKITKDSHEATKKEICEQIGADYLIDDQAKHCLAVAKAGMQAVLFGDYSWNREVKNQKNVVRAHNWQEVLEYFDTQS